MMLEELRSEDFDECFREEPVGTVDPSADVARGRRALRRRRLVGAGSAGATTLAFVVLVIGLQHPSISASPVAPVDPATVPSATRSDPDPTGRSWLLPPDADRPLYYGADRSEPAPNSARPKVDRARALGVAAKSWVDPDLPGTTRAAALRLISSPGDEPDVDGVSSTPRLYWVVIRTIEPVRLHSVPMMGRQTAAEEAASRLKEEQRLKESICHEMILVNANSGRANSILQTCVHR